MGEALTIFYLLVVLKIPTIGMVLLVFWAARKMDDPEVAGESDGDGGQRRRPRLPIGPRRGGPHGAPTLATDTGHDGRKRQAGTSVRDRATRSRERSRSRETSRR